MGGSGGDGRENRGAENNEVGESHGQLSFRHADGLCNHIPRNYLLWVPNEGLIHCVSVWSPIRMV